MRTPPIGWESTCRRSRLRAGARGRAQRRSRNSSASPGALVTARSRARQRLTSPAHARNPVLRAASESTRQRSCRQAGRQDAFPARDAVQQVEHGEVATGPVEAVIGLQPGGSRAPLGGAGGVQLLQRRPMGGPGTSAQMGHAHHRLSGGDHGGEEGIAGVDQITNGRDRHRTEPGDLTRLALVGIAAQQRGEIDPGDDLGLAGESGPPCLPPPSGEGKAHLRQGLSVPRQAVGGFHPFTRPGGASARRPFRRRPSVGAAPPSG
jgi:hypothetical protein